MLLRERAVATGSPGGRSLNMDVTNAFTFAVGVSLFSIFTIVGAALMGAYRFLKNVGVFRGHYYY